MPENPPTPERAPSSPRLSVRWLWIVIGLAAAAGMANAAGGPSWFAVVIVVDAIALYLLVRLMPRPLARAMGRVWRLNVRVAAACGAWSWRWRWWILSVLIALAAFLPVRRAVLMYRVQQRYRALVERGCFLPADEPTRVASKPSPDTELLRGLLELDRSWPGLLDGTDSSQQRSLANALEARRDLEANLAAADRRLAAIRPGLDALVDLLEEFPEATLPCDISDQYYEAFAVLKLEALIAAHRGEAARAARALSAALRLCLAGSRTVDRTGIYVYPTLGGFSPDVRLAHRVLTQTDPSEEDLVLLQFRVHFRPSGSSHWLRPCRPAVLTGFRFPLRISPGSPISIARSSLMLLSSAMRRTQLIGAWSWLLIAGVATNAIRAADLPQAGEDGQAASDVASQAKKPQKKAAAKAPQDRQRVSPSPVAGDQPAAPARIQIVTPDQLMRERIQAEKDLLAGPEHALLVREFKGHAGPVECVAWTPDGKLLLSCSGWPAGDRTVRVWNAKSGKELRQFQVESMPKNPGDSGPREAPGELHTVAVTPDGKQAVTGSTGGAVCLWDIATGALIRQFTGHTGTVFDVAISPRGDLLLTGARDATARVWDFATGAERMQLAGHRSWIRAVAVSPDGKRALTGSYDRVLRLWDLERAEMVRAFQPADAWIWDIVFAPSGQLAAAVSGTYVQIWDLESGALVRNLTCAGAGNGTSVDISPDGRLAVSGGYDGKVRLWDLGSGELLETYTGHREWVWTVKFSPDGQQIASAGGGRFSPAGERVAGIDFALRLCKLPPTRPQVVQP